MTFKCQVRCTVANFWLIKVERSLFLMTGFFHAFCFCVNMSTLTAVYDCCHLLVSAALVVNSDLEEQLMGNINH